MFSVYTHTDGLVYVGHLIWLNTWMPFKKGNFHSIHWEDLDVYFIGASVQCTAMCAWHSFAGMFVLHQMWWKGFQSMYHLIAHVMLLLLYIVNYTDV